MKRPQLKKLKSRLQLLNSKMDQIVDQGGRILLTDPLYKEASELKMLINKIKQIWQKQLEAKE